MRILYGAPPAAGGIRSHLVELVRHFARDHEVMVVSPEDRRLREAVAGEGGHFCGSRALGEQYFTLRRMARVFKPDLMHLHGYKAELLGRLAALGTGTPVVVTLHNYLVYPGSAPLPARAFYLAEKLTPSPVHRYIAVSRALKEDFLRWNRLPSQRVTVIHNGIDPRDYKEAKPLNKWRSLGSPLLGTSLRITWQKGADILVKAAPRVLARFPEAALLISGEGPGEAELKEKVDRMGLKDRIHFPGYVEDFPGFLASLDLFVQPSRTEGLGITLLEALACGIPVVAAAVGGIPEIITSGVHGLLVPPQNPRALAEALIRALEDPEIRQALADKGRERIREEFLLQDMLERTTGVYASLLREKVARPT